MRRALSVVVGVVVLVAGVMDSAMQLDLGLAPICAPLGGLLVGWLGLRRPFDKR